MAGQAYAMVMYKRREQYSRFGIPAEKHFCYFVIPVVIGAVWWLVFILVLALVGTATTAVTHPERFQQVREQAVGVAQNVPTDQVVGALANFRQGFAEGSEVGTATAIRASAQSVSTREGASGSSMSTIRPGGSSQANAGQ
eukprot:g7071.t1